MEHTETDIAFLFACDAHEGQLRKDGTEFIQHPILVSRILEAHDYSDDLIAAGYLHDVVEDTPVTMEDLEAKFNPNVVALVKSNTEDKSKTWLERKTHTIESIKTSTLEEKALLAADKLANVMDISKALKANSNPETYWAKFNAGYEDQKWYYTTVANDLFNSLTKREQKKHDLFERLVEITEQVFGK